MSLATNSNKHVYISVCLSADGAFETECCCCCRWRDRNLDTSDTSCWCRPSESAFSLPHGAKTWADQRHRLGWFSHSLVPRSQAQQVAACGWACWAGCRKHKFVFAKSLLSLHDCQGAPSRADQSENWRGLLVPTNIRHDPPLDSGRDCKSLCSSCATISLLTLPLPLTWLKDLQGVQLSGAHIPVLLVSMSYEGETFCQHIRTRLPDTFSSALP